MSGDISIRDAQVGGNLIAVQGNYIAAAAPAISALHQLPAPPADFTGREAELAELRDALTAGGVAISGLQGMGGVGKTALALKLAAELKPRFPDAQLYLDLRGVSPDPLTPAEAMAHVIRAYHPEAKLPEGEAELQGLYRSVLEGQRALLLMDNAKDAEQVRPLLPPTTCLLLVTSRQHFTLPGLYAKDLSTLPPPDAEKLLRTIAPRIGGQATEIAQACGCLPLALRLAASALAERRTLSTADYLERLNANRLGQLSEVDAAFSASYDLLRPELQSQWALLSIFPATFDRLAAAAVLELKAEAAQDALDELVRYSLAEWDGAQGRYSLHDLARLFASTRLAPDARAAAQARHAQHYLEVSRNADTLYLQGGDSILRGLALFDLEWANIQAGQAWAAAQPKQDETATQVCSAYPDAGAYCLKLRQHPREQITWLEAALRAVRQLENRHAEAAYLGNLGLAYADLGELRRAIELHEQALAMDREIGNRRGEGTTLGNLGTAYKDLGELRRAIELYEQALAIARETGDRRGESSLLNNLGNAYGDLDEPRRAIELYEQALAIDREIGDQDGEGAALGNLGIVYAGLGEPRRAIELCEQQLVIAREIGNRGGQGKALGSLGNAYLDLGAPRRAIEYYEQQLVITREISDRIDEGKALGSLGIAYHQLGELRRAIEYYEQDLRIAREVGDRRGEGSALGNLGIAHHDLGELPRAIELYEQALAIAREIGNRSGEAATLGSLGNARCTLGEPRRGIELYEQALAIAREVGDRQGEGAALGSLGMAYHQLGEPRRAIEYYEQQLVITRDIGDRRGEGSALGSLGIAYADLGEPRRAIEYYEQDLKIAREVGDRRGEGKALGNLGLAYADLGEPRRAIELYEQQLVITRDIGDRQGEANAGWNLGLIYENEGDLPRAIAVMQVYVDFQREIGHPDAGEDAAHVEALRAKLRGKRSWLRFRR